MRHKRIRNLVQKREHRIELQRNGLHNLNKIADVEAIWYCKWRQIAT
jgi:hypothetical protein